MAGTLGRAYIEVMADLSKFSPGLKEKVKAALDEQTKGVKFDELDKSAEKAGDSAAEHVGKGMDGKLDKVMDKEGKKGGASFGKGLTSATGAILGMAMPALIAFGVEAVAALAPAALALGGTLPAAAFTMIGALAVLKMATNGIGDALKSAFDPTKAAQFNEAMKKLSPSARSFVNEIRNLHPAFHQLQQDVQEVFFKQLEGSITRMSRTLLPTLRTGLGQLSQDLGRMGKGLFAALGNGQGDIASIFIAAHQAIVPFIPLVGQLVGAFITIGAVAGPLFASLSGGFARLLTQFVDFINAEADGGGMAQFFDDALIVLQNLGSVLGNVFGLIMDLVQALNASGGEALGLLGSVIKTLNDFFATAEGQDALASIFLLLNAALKLIFAVITPLLPAIAQLAGVFAGGLTDAIVKITPLLVGVADFLAKNPDLLAAAVTAWLAYRGALMAVAAAEAIMDALSPVGWIVLAVAAIAAGAYLIYKNWDAVTNALKVAWSAVGAFFTGIWNWIVSVGASIGNWFTVTLPGFFASIPGRIWAVLSALPAILGQIFLDALHAAGFAIGFGIGLIVAAFITLPGLIWDAIKSIGHLIADLWHMAWAAGDIALKAGINAVVWTFNVLPGKIAGFVNRLPGIIGGAFKSAWSWAKDATESGADAVVRFVMRLPNRIGGFMRNVGHDILSGLKAGINSVISGFNSGIDSVAGAIHIGLPHIPMLASGGLVNAPTLAVVGEAGPEAVIPMSDPAKAAKVAKSTGLLDMLGSKAGSMAANVQVFLGTREITDILDVRIDHKLDNQASELAYGTR